ncbi:hypothetical protein DNTS_027317, partial [Danionella cerebrum]
MKFENLLAEVGGFGKFQISVIALLVIPRVTLPFHFLLNNFIAAIPSHHCAISSGGADGTFQNLTQEERLIISIPAEEDGTLDSCHMFSHPQFHLLTNATDSSELPVMDCQNGWEFDNSTFKSALATEFNLVCEKKGLNKTTATIFFAGVMVGAAIFGWLSDRFGRKRMLMVSYLITISFGLASALSQSFIMFAIMRFCTGVGLTGISIISVVLCVEWADIPHRTIAGVLISLDWSTSTMILPGIAYLVNDWRYLIITVTSPLFLAVITWRWLPESARWLIANGQHEEAHFYLKKCALVNNRQHSLRDIQPEALANVILAEEKSDRTYSCLDLVKSSMMRKLALLTGITWFGVAFTYYGISLNISSFGLNLYLTQFIYGAIELPSKLVAYVSLDKLGRRYSQAGTLITTGICIGITVLIPRDLWIPRTVVAVLGKGFSEASFTCVILYTTEIYPTVLRQNGLGYSSFVGRVGVCLAPLVSLLDEVWLPLPEVMFCSVAITAGVVALLLPETHNVRLPETIEDIEKPRKKSQLEYQLGTEDALLLTIVLFDTRVKMRFEDVLSELNGFGRFQKLVLCINFFGRFSLTCHFLLGNFIAFIPSHHCDITLLDTDGIFGNLTEEERLIISIPAQEDGTPASCHMFSHPQLHLLANSSNTLELPVVQCQNGWEFDNSIFISTLASEWDLVCDRRTLSKLTTTIFFIGVMFGAGAFGSLSAMFGRKPMLLVSYILGMAFGLFSAWSSSFIMFAVLRFFTGFTITGSVIISTVLNVEWVSIEHRKLVGVIDSLAWTFGFASFPMIAYFIRDWRWLTAAVSLPTVTAIITWWWVPESARWLIANGKADKAHFYLHKCATINNKKEGFALIKPEDLSKIIVTDRGNRTYSYMDLVKTPKMRRLALLTGITWFSVSFNITGFGLNMYLTQFVYGAIEIPAKFSIYYLLDKFGRHVTQAASLLLVGISLMVNLFIPKDRTVLRTVIAVLGKGCSATSFGTVILYTSELYPTVVRQNGMGYTSFVARLGVSVAPLILLSNEIWSSFSQVILSALALSAAFVAYRLPETRGRCLPETIEDIEGIRARSEGARMKFENLLAEVGGFGKFQISVIALSVIPRVTLPFHFLLNNFIAAIPSHHCAISSGDADGTFQNLTQEERLIISIPAEEDVLDCQNGWEFDNSTFKSALATEFNLVCEKKGLNKTTATIFFAGVMVGAAIFGWLSDSNFIAAIPSHHCAFSPLDAVGIFENLTQEERLVVSFPLKEDGTPVSCGMYSSPQFHLLTNSTDRSDLPVVDCQNGWEFDNSTFISTLATQWNLVCDNKGVNKAVSTIFFIGVMFGAAFFGGMSDRFGRKPMLLVSYISGMAFTLASIFSSSFVMFAVLRFFSGFTITGIVIVSSVLKSARWLIANGKTEKAHFYLHKCAVMNRKEHVISTIKPEALSFSVSDQGNKKYSYLDLFKTPGIRKLALLTGTIWYFVYGAIEVPSKLMVYYLLEKIGRRKTEAGAQLLAGVSLMINIFIPKEQWIGRTVVAVLGKGFIVAAFCTIALFSSELYPTVLRQNGMGFNSFLGRLGVAIAPLVLMLDTFWGQFSQSILCSVAFIASVVAWQLPET